MRNLFLENKIFVAIIICGILILGVIYFSNSRGLENNNNVENIVESKKENDVAVQNKNFQNNIEQNTEQNTEQKCNFDKEVLVTKVIDGDTVIVEGGKHVRLIGIDADEVGYPCYESAKKELENLVLNKKVILQKDISVTDKYDRCLNYVFLNTSVAPSASYQNINVEMIKRGLAVARFYEPDVKHKTEIQYAENQAIKDKIGCKWSNLK